MDDFHLSALSIVHVSLSSSEQNANYTNDDKNQNLHRSLNPFLIWDYEGT